MAAADQNLSAADRRRIIRRLFHYLARRRLRLLGGAALALIVSLANLFSLTAFVPIFNAMGGETETSLFELGAAERANHQLWLEGRAAANFEIARAHITDIKVRINQYFAGKSARDTIITLCLMVFPVHLLKVLCITAAIYLSGTAGLLAVRDLRLELYGNLTRVGMETFGQERTGILMSRVVNDVELIGKSLSVEFNEAMIDIFYVITHLALLAYIDWQLLLITLIGVPILTAPVSRFAARIRRAARGQQERLAELGGHIQEVISGIRVIRAFSMEEFERSRFRQINEKLYENTFRGHYYHQVGPALTEITATLVVTGFLAWGAWKIELGALNKGQFMAFFITLIFLMGPIKQLSVLTNLLAGAVVAANRVFDMLDAQSGVSEASQPRPFSGVQDCIEFRNVGFRYPGAERAAIQNISFRTPRGAAIALAGASGAGKSTMMDLLPRFYDPGEGQILIDGVDLREYELRSLRTGIGLVSQDVFLFHATIRENIAYGHPDASLEQIQAAAQAANADEFIQRLPQGYDTPIGERGVMLSGGQRQRLAIARALIQDPPILVLDEATSNLDNESERLVQQAIERLEQGRTTFIVAHRLSTIFRCDEILVLDQGRIVQRGRHEQLLAADGPYRRLYEMQFAEQNAPG
ncbi:MAG: ABC transporter ATP-binding protein/permease [Leptospirales bacterium]|nr:ABC transporter ATP-binding protein/permease [Leptospirales bacterium]